MNPVGGGSPERSGRERNAPEPSDGEVVRAVLEGRTGSYRLLVRRYQDVLFRHVARMVVDPDDAADIVQEAFVTGYRKLESCREPERVGGWLYRIASNLCKDHLKSRSRDRVALEDAPPLETPGDGPQDAAARGEFGEALSRALEELVEEQREAFLLKHLEGYSYEEMSGMLGVSVPALKMRVHRAREALRERLEEFG